MGTLRVGHDFMAHGAGRVVDLCWKRWSLRASEGMVDVGWPQGQGFTSGFDPCLVEPHLYVGGGVVSCEVG
jgi:hypothetical protein